MLYRLSAILAFASYTTAHFVLNWPPTAGFDDDTEDTAPCGGITVTVNGSSAQVDVNRFAANIQVTHPTGSFSFLATTNTAAPYNFTTIGQNISSTGIGSFCADYLHVPSSFAGKAGIIQVIDNSVDGVLYQCAAVNFINGTSGTFGDSCKNSSTSISYSNGNASSTATTTTSSSKAMAAMATMAMAPVLGGLGAVAAGLVL